jgi:Tfp pilus assembly protein PilO
MKWPTSRYHLPLGIGLAAVILLLGAILPHTQRVRAAHAECAAMQAGLARQADVLARAGQAARRVAEGREWTRRFEVAVPVGPQMGPLLESLDELAGTCGLREVRVQPDAPLEGGPVGCLPVAVQFRGTFPAAYDFVERAESLPRVAWVQRFELARTQREGDELSGTVTLLVYYREEAKP